MQENVIEILDHISKTIENEISNKVVSKMVSKTTTLEQSSDIPSDPKSLSRKELPGLEKKGRKIADYQPTEVIIAGALCCGPTCIDIDDLIDKLNEKPFNLIINPKPYKKYLEELKTRRDDKYLRKKDDKYLRQFNKFRLKYMAQKDIKNIFLIGKTMNNIPCSYRPKLKNVIAECNSLNRSDVYIEYVDEKFEGISIKADKNATKMNLSVEKMIKEVVGVDLATDRKEILSKAGFKDFRKGDRPEHNKQFYGKNTYWDNLNKQIVLNNRYITDQLERYLYPRCAHKIFEFDGEDMRELTNIVIDKPTILQIDQHANMYTPTNRIRRAAKQFYMLKCNDKTYQCEIRWKGNIFTASPQFQIHNRIYEGGS